jgi:hypothetical protein
LFFLPLLAGAAALVTKPAAAQRAVATSNSTSSSGYRLTPHIERFYRSAGRL